MIAFLESLTLWHWLVFGAGLMTVEIFLPGAFFLWPGLAAILVGLMSSILPLHWTTSVTLWALLSLATVTGWTFYRKKHPRTETQNTLNQRGHEYIGRQFTLEKPVVNGAGEIHTADTVWKIVAGADYPAGTIVRVTGVEGTSLRVESP